MEQKSLFATALLLAMVVFVISPIWSQGDLSVVVKEILVDGAFEELSDATQQLVAPFKGRRTTVREFEALAHAVELMYQDAGYFLVRVTIPPQEVNDGDALHLLVIDGYLEGVDFYGIPEPVRPHLAKILGPIVNRQRLLFDTYERYAMVARQTPGLSIQTTLTPGEGTGAALLAVEGEWKRFAGSFSLNKRLSDTESSWNTSLGLNLNQLLGRGERIAVNFSAPTSSLFPRPADEKSRTIAVSVSWPLGTEGMKLHLSHNGSHTYAPSPHVLIPATSTDIRRTSLELSRPVRLTRTDELRVSVSLDEAEQAMKAPDFHATLYHDRIRVFRIGIDRRRETPTGSRLSSSWQLSQGLTWRGRSVKDVHESGIPTSRPGVSLTFQKIALTVSHRWRFESGMTLTSTLRAQSAVSGPLPGNELFGLSGGNALPSLALGVGANDAGWTLREEIEKPLSLPNPMLHLSLYGYAAVGGGVNNVAGTSAFASAFGIGLRGDAGPMRLSLGYVRGRSGLMEDDTFEVSVEVAF